LLSSPILPNFPHPGRTTLAERMIARSAIVAAALL
jgi:hypothetical protein